MMLLKKILERLFLVFVREFGGKEFREGWGIYNGG